MPVCADMPVNQNDELALLDEDDSVDPEDEIQGTDIPYGFRVQAYKPAALDSSLLQRGVFVRLGMGWFGGLITGHLQHSQHEPPVGKIQWRPGCSGRLMGLLQRNVAERGKRR